MSAFEFSMWHDRELRWSTWSTLIIWQLGQTKTFRNLSMKVFAHRPLERKHAAEELRATRLDDAPCEQVRAPSTAAIESKDCCRALKSIDLTGSNHSRRQRSAFGWPSISSSSTSSKYSPFCARDHPTMTQHMPTMCR